MKKTLAVTAVDKEKCKINVKEALTINKHLLPLKLLLFAYWAATSALLPYLTVHMKQIGITVGDTAIIYAVLPFASFIGPPIAGMFADRLGNYRPILIVCLIATAGCHTLLLIVPNITTVTHRTRTLDVLCDSHGVQLQVEKCQATEDCKRELILRNYEMNFNLTDCVEFCEPSGPEYTLVEPVPAPSLALLSRDSLCISSTNESGVSYEPCSKMQQLVQSINLTEFQLNLIEDSGGRCSYSNSQQTSNLNCYTQEEKCFISCPYSGRRKRPVNTTLHNIQQSLSQCPSGPPSDKQATFWSYFVIRVFATIFLGTCFSMLDATTFKLVKEHEGEFGIQRVGCALAAAIFSPMVGALVDYVSYKRGFTDYGPTFYVFDAFLLVTIFLAFWLHMPVEKDKGNMRKEVQMLLKQLDILLFFVIIFLLGCMWGFVETFVPWFMIDLGSPKYVIGLTVTVGSLLGIPVVYMSERILRTFGNMNVLVFVFMVYGIRFIGYSFITDPYMCLILESLEALTYHLMWVTVATYSGRLAPKGLLATMQGAAGGIHYGIGRGAGTLAGGTLMNYYGARITFQVMAAVSFSGGVFTILAYYTYMRKVEIRKQEAAVTEEKTDFTKKKPSPP